MNKLLEKVNSKYVTNMSVKELFIELTRMQIPFNYEHTLEHYLPKDIQKDEHGNYFIKIGESKTMFCAHLDTYCRDYKPVNHIFDGDIIRTDGTTTLGADDKAGVVIMLKMIQSGVSGLYYFFRGEEGVTSPSGTWGSRQALKTRKDFFKDYEKCVAFDRRGKGSIITSQLYSECCSSDFSKELSKQFNQVSNLVFEDDDTGMWCDSGVFMDLIPECTNISVGYVNEHKHNEEQDIRYLEELVNACLDISWDDLPVKRDPSAYGYGYGYYHKHKSTKNKRKKYTYQEYPKSIDIFTEISNDLRGIGYTCLVEPPFEECDEIYYQNFKTNDFFALKVISNTIFISDEKIEEFELIGDINDFKNTIRTNYDIIDDEDDDDDYTGIHSEDDIYMEMVEKSPKLVSDIYERIDKYGIYNTLSNDMYNNIEILIDNLGFVVSYDSDGLNGDNFVEWLEINRDFVNSTVEDIELSELTFIDTISESEYMATFNDEQYSVFSNFVDNEQEFIKSIISNNDKGIFDLSEDMKSKLNWLIVTSGYRTNENSISSIRQKFISWVYLYDMKIKRYYGM